MFVSNFMLRLINLTQYLSVNDHVVSCKIYKVWIKPHF